MESGFEPSIKTFQSFPIQLVNHYTTGTATSTHYQNLDYTFGKPQNDLLNHHSNVAMRA